jgi:hypothetical protein
MKKFSLLLNVILIGVIAYGGYKFLIEGSVRPTDDGRTAILLTAGERDHILGDMRGFLETVQGINEALGQGDLKTVADIATAAGSAAAEGAPAALIGKLPLDFKNLGMATHGLFDDLAKTATESGDVATTTAALGDLMLNCTGCHAGYRFDVEGTGK